MIILILYFIDTSKIRLTKTNIQDNKAFKIRLNKIYLDNNTKIQYSLNNIIQEDSNNYLQIPFMIIIIITYIWKY